MRLHFSGELSRQKRAIWVWFAIAAERFHGVDVAAKKTEHGAVNSWSPRLNLPVCI
jgi:hypothetical protein